MTRATRIGRLAGLAVGLGIGAALAATPGVASADDFQISIDGMDLFPTTGNLATATSGMGDIAIAIGNGEDANATGGTFDSAFADGTGSLALVENGSFDYASAIGDGSKVAAGYGNFDTALANGTDSGALASGDLLTIGGTTTLIAGNDDFAAAWGPNTIASAGDLLNVTPSSDDVATVFDPFGTVGSSAFTGIGNFDLATVFGDMLTANAYGGDDLVTILSSLF
jgi:hypothetical protein